jgi:hypothetical protein
MKQCPQCGRGNSATSQYCENCGSIFKTQTANTSWYDYTVASVRNIPPPPPPPLTPYLNAESINPFPTVTYFDDQKLAETQQALTSGKGFIHIINVTFSILLYLIGAASASFGAFGTFSFTNTSLGMICFLCLALINIVVLVIMLKRTRSSRLRWWMRLLWSIGATFVGLIMIFIGFGIVEISHGSVPSTPLTDLIIGPIVILYGIVIEFIAFR